MKLKTVLVAATAAGIGYVLGTKAGRTRFEQIRGQAQEFINSPKVQDTVANLSDTVKQSAQKLPDPVAGVVNAVADSVKSSTASQQEEPPSTSPTTPTAPTPSTSPTPPTPPTSPTPPPQ
ncbi:MAG TPA: hypothetical protein VE476_12150 [Propionibacteriaceae bacterium]|jgi:hypothetical protein|nr:hypothetical protein [Propionibacteriaceae bacterium]